MSKRVSSLPVDTQKSLVEWGEKADASNLERDLLSLPVELTTEILDYFPTIGPYTASYNYRISPILPAIFLVRGRVLRALSQVCIDYRRGFLPLLWDSLDLCFKMRQVSPRECRNDMPIDLYCKPVVEAQLCKFDGLSANPNLASYIG